MLTSKLSETIAIINSTPDVGQHHKVILKKLEALLAMVKYYGYLKMLILSL